VADRGERLACREMRKHMQAYTHGIPGAAQLRRALTSAETRAEYLRAVNGYLERRPQEAAEEARA
jgi:tRNA-dihydrouridine synthase B